MDNIKAVEIITTLHKIAVQQDMINSQLIEINERTKILPEILKILKLININLYCLNPNINEEALKNMTIQPSDK